MPTAPPAATQDTKIETQVFWIKYHKEITALLVMALLAAIGFAAYRFYSERQDLAAALLLAKAKTAPDYQELTRQYPNAPAAASAYLLWAQAQRAEKNFAASNETLREFIAKNPKHELASSARLAIAANLESLGKNDDALSIYEQTVASDPKSFNAPLALISQIHLLRAKNRIEDARRVCENILMNYSDSFWANEAMRELRTLKPSASAPSPARSTSSSPGGSAVQPPPMLARPPEGPAPSAAPRANPAKKPN